MRAFGRRSCILVGQVWVPFFQPNYTWTFHLPTNFFNDLFLLQPWWCSLTSRKLSRSPINRLFWIKIESNLLWYFSKLVWEKNSRLPSFFVRISFPDGVATIGVKKTFLDTSLTFFLLQTKNALFQTIPVSSFFKTLQMFMIPISNKQLGVIKM